MHTFSHLILSWMVGHRLENRRDRRLVAWAGVAPDLDGLTLLAGIDFYGRWHHVLSHGLMAALVVSVVWTIFAIDKIRVAILALFAFHLHLLCDLIGAGRWGIAYLWPLTSYEWKFSFSWPLVSWQNASITAAAIAACAYIGVVYGRTFAEAFLPSRADRAVVEMLRNRFGSDRQQN